MGAESGMNSSVRDDRVALSDGAKALWGKTNRIDDSEWLPLYVHMVDSAAMASKIWDTWVPQGTKAVIVGDLGNDEVLARKLMIFMAGIHDIGKATPVFQAKSITFGPEAGSFAWKAERAGLPMIAGLRGTNHPTHPIAGEIILEGYLLRVRGWERKAARQYACVVGGHHGTPPDKSKIDEEKNRKTNVGLDSEAWVSTQDELIDFVANIAGIEEKEWEDLSERRFSVQSAVLMTGLVIMADWIASNSDEDMFPLVRTEPWADEDEDFFFSESGEEDDIQSWSGLRIRADRAWSCVQLPHAWVPEGIPSSCQDLFATRFTLPEGAKVRPVQEEAVRIARDTRQPGLMVIEAPMGEGKTEAALAAAEILAQRTGRGGVCVALPTMATTDAMFTRVRRWLEALPSCDFDNEKTVWLAHGKAQLNNDFRGMIFDLQREYTAESGSNARSRARLARLRRDLDGTAPTWMSIGEELFAQWPQELEAPADDSPEFDRQVNAVKVALELYAVHQQSKGQGVAQKYQTDPSSRMTFGRACRRITPDPEQAKGVLRRLRVVESASDFNGVVRGVRTLIMLMRGADVQIDYGSLARDLYLIQLPSQRGKVFQSWGRDYYYSKQSSNNNR